MTLERAPRNGHVCRVNKSKNGYQKYAKQKQSVWDAVVSLEILPLLSPVPLTYPQQHQYDCDGPHEIDGDGERDHHKHHDYIADVKKGIRGTKRLQVGGDFIHDSTGRDDVLGFV